MNIYLCDEVIFNNSSDAFEFIAKLPRFALCQVNKVNLSEKTIIYQVVVYSFDDEIDVSDYID